jgi:putative SOS response-associated peptidase YedK
MWTSMKKKKRCIVVAQGFYEWLKKNNGKDKLPHYTKRKDGQLMCFAGLWDCVQYEGESSSSQATAWCSASFPRFLSACLDFPVHVLPADSFTDRLPDSDEKLYTYTVITTDSNKQLSFLHDRMPVILENGSDAIRTWLDPNRTEWSRELQALLKPYEGELECYPVSKDVGKVGNNSPSFIVPIDSADNKNNIANFFGNQRKAAKPKQDEGINNKPKHDMEDSKSEGIKVEHDVNETRETTNQVQGTEDNAPLPVPATMVGEDLKGIKRERNEADDEEDGDTADGAPQQKRRIAANSAPSPKRSSAKTRAKGAKKTRSATTNGNATKSPSKGDGSRKITSFFSK